MGEIIQYAEEKGRRGRDGTPRPVTEHVQGEELAHMRREAPDARGNWESAGDAAQRLVLKLRER